MPGLVATKISTAIGQCLGKAYPYALSSGQAIAGRPFTRYLSAGPGLFAMEIGVPISAAAPGEGDVEAGSLPAGATVVGVHAGPYDQLGETYAAMERSIETNGLKAAGPPWESVHDRPGRACRSGQLANGDLLAGRAMIRTSGRYSFLSATIGSTAVARRAGT